MSLIEVLVCLIGIVTSLVSLIPQFDMIAIEIRFVPKALHGKYYKNIAVQLPSLLPGILPRLNKQIYIYKYICVCVCVCVYTDIHKCQTENVINFSL
jgi:hypothetical protein